MSSAPSGMGRANSSAACNGSGRPTTKGCTLPRPMARCWPATRASRAERPGRTPRPPEVPAQRLTGRVRAVEGAVAWLAYEGELTGSHLTQAKKRTHGTARLTGVGRYDLRTGQLLSFVWVFDGIYRGPAPYDQPQ